MASEKDKLTATTQRAMERERLQLNLYKPA